MIGAVAIGRNEGARLVACLKALTRDVSRVVYVDSGSTDGSVEAARSMGVEVVALDLSTPFTAARARNEGLDRLLEIEPGVSLVQFVDGDCELVDEFIDKARTMLDEEPRIAVVWGRRRERHPEASLWNKLVDREWDMPVGEATLCGGDALMRVSALREVGGYDASVIAGEEPEMCFRLRARGWRIYRIDAEMTWHDASMVRFSQWWKRGIRAGHAAAEGAWMHGRSPERYFVRETLRPVFWAGVLPFGALLIAWWTWGLSLVALAGVYVLQWWRMRGRETGGSSLVSPGTFAMFMLIGQFALFLGVLTLVKNRLLRRRTDIIEYKSAAEPISGDPASATHDG